jgi:hypothetical protein
MRGAIVVSIALAVGACVWLAWRIRVERRKGTNEMKMPRVDWKVAAVAIVICGIVSAKVAHLRRSSAHRPVVGRRDFCMMCA